MPLKARRWSRREIIACVLMVAVALLLSAGTTVVSSLADPRTAQGLAIESAYIIAEILRIGSGYWLLVFPVIGIAGYRFVMAADHPDVNP